MRKCAKDKKRKTKIHLNDAKRHNCRQRTKALADK